MNKLATISHFRLILSAMTPENALMLPYTQRKTAMSRPKLAASISSCISTCMAGRMVEII